MSLTDPSGVLDSIDQSLTDWQVSSDAMRWTPEPLTAAEYVSPGHLLIAGFVQRIVAAMPGIRKALQSFAVSLNRTARNMHLFLARVGALDGHRRARCRICSPRANPKRRRRRRR